MFDPAQEVGYNISLDKLYYSIGEVARLSGVRETTLRYWDKRGILSPSRRNGKRRYYTAKDIDKAKRIKELTDDGLTLDGAVKKLSGTSKIPPEVVQEIKEIIAMIGKLRDGGRGKPEKKRNNEKEGRVKRRQTDRREGLFG
ncbi:MAG: helix-turn-helix domain-containing protein [candidate division WOR-3 bacterium]